MKRTKGFSRLQIFMKLGTGCGVLTTGADFRVSKLAREKYVRVGFRGIAWCGMACPGVCGCRKLEYRGKSQL